MHMASTVQDTIAEKIEIVDQPDDTEQKGGLKLWLAIPLGFILLLSAFFVVRRLFAPGDEE